MLLAQDLSLRQLRNKVVPRLLVETKLEVALTVLEKLDHILASKTSTTMWNALSPLLTGGSVTLASGAVVSGLTRRSTRVLYKPVQDQYRSVLEYMKGSCPYPGSRTLIKLSSWLARQAFPSKGAKIEKETAER